MRALPAVPPPEYRTIGGVSGPLVVVESVKVRRGARSIAAIDLSLVCVALRRAHLRQRSCRACPVPATASHPTEAQVL